MNAPEALPLDRKTFLGGSDAAAVLGVSPWATAFDVFLEKTGQPPAREPDPDREKLFRRGKRLEPIVVDMLAEEYGVKIVKRSTPAKPNRYVDPEHPFLAVEVDYEFEVTPKLAALVSERQPAIAETIMGLVGSVQNGEVKTCHHFASRKFGEKGTEDTPIEYTTQAMDGLMVTGRQLCMSGVLIGADDLSVYWTRRDDSIIKMMRPRLVDFWLNYVLAGVPPEAQKLDDVLQWFGIVPPMTVEANEDAIAWLSEMTAAKETVKQLDVRIEELKYELGKYMLGESAIQWQRDGSSLSVRPTDAAPQRKHQLVHKGWPLLSVGRQNQSRLDTDAIRQRHPEVALECGKKISFYRFDQPKGKK